MLAALCIFAIASGSPIIAQTQTATGKPTVFKVTVTKVELHNGTTFVTVYSGSTQLDLVAAGNGAAFPAISNLTLPAGTYTQIRVTFANQFGVQGSLAFGGVTWYVTSTIVPDTGGGAAQASSSAGAAGEATLLNPAWGALGASVVQTITIPSITVGASTHYQPTVKFDVTNSLALWEMGGVSHYMTLAPITITVL
jgi:hypothetical protein